MNPRHDAAPGRHAPPAEEWTFASADGTRLRGTLTRPSGEGPFPAALLLVGSGPVDRDSNARRLPLSVTDRLADHLARAGVASLRYDKRGVGDSGGDFLAASFHDNTADARAALAELRGADGVDDARVVVVGHSEGALHATALGAEDDLAGIALLSGCARPGEQVLRWQAETLVPTLPRLVRVLLRLLRVDVGRRQTKLFDRLRATDQPVARSGGRRINAGWFREFLAFDPAPLLARIDLPVLAVTGDKDLQAPPEDVARIGELVTGPFEGVVVPDVSHVLRREAGTPSVRAYRRQAREPLDERVTTAVLDWCLRVTAPQRRRA